MLNKREFPHQLIDHYSCLNIYHQSLLSSLLALAPGLLAARWTGSNLSQKESKYNYKLLS